LTFVPDIHPGLFRKRIPGRVIEPNRSDMAKKSGIYTKGGDRGETSLLGGKRVLKFHPRIESYGMVDELMAHTTMLRDLVDDPGLKEELLVILDMQMCTASMLAADCDDCPVKIPVLGEEHIQFLENRIDEMDATLEPLHSFVIPGGHPAVSQAHIARTVCRRTERTILKMMPEIQADEVVIRFYNRLSDYFFVLSRRISAIFGIEQIPWNPML
jgi:cob(I)alamin adenosyltransferase